MDPERARRWKGLRQDSGDPFVYAPRAKQVYESLGIDPREKTIIFSDALSVGKAKKLKAQCDEVGFIGKHLDVLNSSEPMTICQHHLELAHRSQMTL